MPVAPTLHRAVINKVTMQLDQKLFDSVVDGRHFTSWGVVQFRHDIEELCHVLHSYLSEPLQHLPLVKEAMALLAMPAHQLEELVRDLKQEQRQHLSLLRKRGISHLSPSQVSFVCSNMLHKQGSDRADK